MQVSKVKFEVALYELLRSEPNIMASNPLNYRILVQQVGPGLDVPQDIIGRCLLMLKRADGENIQWWELSPKERVRAHANNCFAESNYVLLNLSLGLSACSFSPYPRVTVQLQSPA